MGEKILVPLDGSELSEGVLPHVESLARRFGLKVVLLEVVDDEVEAAAAEFVRVERLETAGEAVEMYLQRLAAQLRAVGLEVEWAVGFGDPVHSILEQAKARRVVGIAMSTHGRSGIDHFLHGSVAEKVTHLATIPVMLVKPGQSETPDYPGSLGGDNGPGGDQVGRQA